MSALPIVQKYDPDEAAHDRKSSGATGTWAVKVGHAQMLKGGVIMGASAARACKSTNAAGRVRYFLVIMPLLSSI